MKIFKKLWKWDYLKKLGIENLVLTTIQILIKIVTRAVKTSSINFIFIHRNNSIII